MNPLTNRWFLKSSQAATSTDQNSRFAERLNAVWFKYTKESRLRPGRIFAASARLGKFLTDLHERVLKLEAAQPLYLSSFAIQGASSGRISSANRTATGISALKTEALNRLHHSHDEDAAKSPLSAPSEARAKFRQLLKDEVEVASNIQNLVSLNVISAEEGQRLKNSLRDDLLAWYNKLPLGVR